MSAFTLVMPYYNNPQMLQEHVANWNSFKDDTKKMFNIVLVDDGSSEIPDEIFRKTTIKHALFRIEEDIPFNAHGARNLGMKVMGKDDQWALLTDMDVLFPEEAIRAISRKDFDSKNHYTMERMFVDGRPPKQHCNSFLVQRRAFWKAGGYDEDFCGCYGGDGIFLRALERHAKREHWLDVVSVGYNGTIEDCSTRGLDRHGPMKEEYLKRRGNKKATNSMEPKNPLRFKWNRVY